MVAFTAAFLLLALPTASCAAVAWDTDNGRADWKHLKLPASAADAGRAGGGVALGGVGRGEALQPAALAGTDRSELGFGRILLPRQQGGSVEQLRISGPAAAGALEFTSSLLRYDAITGYDEDGAELPAYGAGAWLFGLGYARTKGATSYGLRVHGGNYAIDHSSSWAVMADFGLTCNLPRVAAIPGRFSLGSAMRNVGGGTPFVERELILPFELNNGIAWQLERGRWSGRLGADWRHRNDEPEAAIFWAEGEWQHMLTLRLGRPVGEAGPGWSSGVGLAAGIFRIDYGFVADGLQSGRHQFSAALAL
jgi:hypothetical protein